MNKHPNFSPTLFAVLLLAGGLWAGEPQNGLNFDGTNDTVQLPVMNLSGDALTIEYWFKGTVNQSAVRQQSGTDYIIAGVSGKHALSNDGGTASGIATGNATDGFWHHLAFTWQRSTVNGFVSYLDGVLVAQRDSSATALPNIAANVYVGSLNGSSEFAAGTLDEIRIWNVARSQAQIQANMRLEVDPASTGLRAYYRCNQGMAEANNAGLTTLADLTLAGAHGTLQNFALTGSTSNWVSASVLGVTSSAVYTLDTTPTWLWSGGPHGVGAFRHQLDSQSGGWTSTPDTNWTPLSPLSAGEHTLYVQEQDWSGTWSPSGSFRVIVFSGIVYVTPAGGGAFDGSSWANALSGAALKSWLDVVPAGIEFWVAAGTYTPVPASTSFVLKNGLALYGGFAGTETARAQRDWAANVTVLSGANSSRVVRGTTGGTIDGFTITGGKGQPGGGMLIDSGASASVVNCSFSGNHSTSDGGGMYNYSSSLSITNCTFSGNSCSIDGGAIYNVGSPATISGCTFSNNTSNDDGGAIYSRAATTVTKCIFTGNHSNDDGGAIYADVGGTAVVTNCLFTANSSGYWGGAICSYSSGAASVTNCTFSGNTAAVAGAAVRNSGVSTLTNCIVWSSAAPAQIVNVGTLAVTYCCVKGGFTGAGNTASDPLFVDAAAGDFHLQPGSPCLDSGTGTGAPATDKDGNGRYDVRAMPNGGGAPAYVDMGVFEAQGLASWTLNLNTGILALTFPWVADGASLVAGGLVIQDAATATKSYRLTGLGAAPVDGTTLSLLLSAQDLNALKVTPGLAKDLATAWLRLDADSVYASAGPAMMPSPDGYAIQASSFTGDSGRPTLAALTSTTPDGAYAAGATINVTVNFSEPVTLVGGTLNVTLDTGAVVSISAFGPALSASASYTVAAGQNSADLTATAVALGAGATLADTSSLVIITPIPLPATNIATGSAVIIDTSAPAALASGSPLAGSAPLAVAFVGHGTDAGGYTLRYAWNFGDGTPASSEQNPTHTFAVPGIYTVTLVVSDGHGGTGTASLTVLVTAPITGMPTQLDSDADGYSDEIENALGSDPNSVADTPAGMAAATQTIALPLSKIAIKLNTTPDSDALSLSGSVLISEGMTLAGQQVVVNVGGVVKTFTLDEKGATPKGNDSFKLKVKTGKDGTPLQVATFAVTCLKGNFAAALADEGVSTGAAKGTKATVPVTVIFNGISFQKAVSVTSTGKLWQMAKKK